MGAVQQPGPAPDGRVFRLHRPEGRGQRAVGATAPGRRAVEHVLDVDVLAAEAGCSPRTVLAGGRARPPRGLLRDVGLMAFA